jgi:hypothetical protein
MSTEYNEYKFKKARKNVIVGGMVILVAITLLSCVSSFMIYWESFYIQWIGLLIILLLFVMRVRLEIRRPTQ